MIDYLIALGLFVGGWLLGLFGWAQILITTRFGIPYVRDLQRQNMLIPLYADTIVSAYKKARVLWTIIILAVVIAVFLFVTLMLGLIGFAVGLLVSFFSILRKSGPSDDNIKEFAERHYQIIDTFDGEGEEHTAESVTNHLLGSESLRRLHLLSTRQKWPGVYK